MSSDTSLHTHIPDLQNSFEKKLYDEGFFSFRLLDAGVRSTQFSGSVGFLFVWSLIQYCKESKNEGHQIKFATYNKLINPICYQVKPLYKQKCSSTAEFTIYSWLYRWKVTLLTHIQCPSQTVKCPWMFSLTVVKHWEQKILTVRLQFILYIGSSSLCSLPGWMHIVYNHSSIYMQTVITVTPVTRGVRWVRTNPP